MLAKVGLEALVPRMGWGYPATTTTMSRPCVATSGKARPVLLNLPARGFVGSELDVVALVADALSMLRYLEAAANCATFEDKPSLPQSYCWVVGMILNTGEVIFYSMVCNLSGILGEKEKEEGDGCQS